MYVRIHVFMHFFFMHSCIHAFIYSYTRVLSYSSINSLTRSHFLSSFLCICRNYFFSVFSVCFAMSGNGEPTPPGDELARSTGDTLANPTGDTLANSTGDATPKGKSKGNSNGGGQDGNPVAPPTFALPISTFTCLSCNGEMQLNNQGLRCLPCPVLHKRFTAFRKSGQGNAPSAA